MKLCVLVIAWCLVGATQVASAQDKRIDKLEFSAVTREIDLTSNLVKEKTTIVVENKDQKTISSFLYTIPRSAADKLAYIGGQVTASVYAMIIPINAHAHYTVLLYKHNRVDSLCMFNCADNYEQWGNW